MGESEDFGGDHLILGEQKGRSVVTESPKVGDQCKFWKVSWRGGTTQICLDNASLRAYKINVPILLGDDSVGSLNLF